MVINLSTARFRGCPCDGWCFSEGGCKHGGKLLPYLRLSWWTVATRHSWHEICKHNHSKSFFLFLICLSFILFESSKSVLLREVLPNIEREAHRQMDTETQSGEDTERNCVKNWDYKDCCHVVSWSHTNRNYYWQPEHLSDYKTEVKAITAYSLHWNITKIRILENSFDSKSWRLKTLQSVHCLLKRIFDCTINWKLFSYSEMIFLLLFGHQEIASTSP